ncbi:Hsp70 protein-domain-containing protein [Rhexocercosporidium sp. MPI-PUGE-AT-0058]|nr:Hsp70 protein-domain-containing protein [Rhexocercosporidium sp. MPI-PUGE-AT-0058]
METRHFILPTTAIGIELGRNYSRVAIFRDFNFEIIVDEQGRSKIPFGFEEENCNRDEPVFTLRDFSSSLGLEWSDSEFQASIKNLPYDVASQHGKVMIRVPVQGKDTYLAAEKILSSHLTRLKHVAEVHLNETVGGAVISVPSYFNDAQKKAVDRSAMSAGFNVQLLVSESRAIDNAYPTNSIVTKRGKGEHNVPDSFLTCSIGENWLSMAVKYSLRQNHREVGSLEDRVQQDDVDIEWSNDRITNHAESILKMVEIDQENITAIVISGESPQIDILELIMESLFSTKKILKNELFGHDQATVYGAASMAYWHFGYRGETYPYFVDCTLLDLGFRSQGDTFIKVISKDTPIPKIVTQTVTTATDDEGNVMISVYQGMSSAASENEILGSMEFDMLSMGPGLK